MLKISQSYYTDSEDLPIYLKFFPHERGILVKASENDDEGWGTWYPLLLITKHGVERLNLDENIEEYFEKDNIGKLRDVI